MIGKAITSILTNDATVTGYVGTKIFPIMMIEGTLLPCISYTVNSIESTYVKPSWANDIVRFQVNIFANSYAGVSEIASAVRTALERTAGTYATTIILGPIYMDGYAESYDLDGDSYVISLNFRTQVKQY